MGTTSLFLFINLLLFFFGGGGGGGGGLWERTHLNITTTRVQVSTGPMHCSV